MTSASVFDPREIVKVPAMGKRSSATERTRFIFKCSGARGTGGRKIDSHDATG
jgi:hypothetical protein